MRKKIIITFHEVWGKLWFELPFLTLFQRWAFWLFEKLLLQLPFTRFVGVSAYTAAALGKAGVAKKRIVRIYNGLDYEQIRTLIPEPRESEKGKGPYLEYLYYGRLGVSKGLELILPAFRKLVDRDANCRLVLNIPAGPQKIRNFLERQIEDLQLADYASIRPPVKAFRELALDIYHTDVVLIPSYSEGFCFVAAETCAIGTPVISSGRGALPEVVSGKWNDMQEQSVDGLAKAMWQAREGKWKQGDLRTFPLSRTVNQYLECYSRISS